MKTILCYGDSNTYGYVPGDGDRYPENVRWTGRLQKLLGPEYKVIEQGLNARTTVYDDPFEMGKNGLTTLLPTLMCYEWVDIVVLMLGTNDLKEYFHTTEEALKKNVGRLIDEINDYYQQIYKKCPRIILMAPPEVGVWPGGAGSKEYWDWVVETSRRFPEIYKAVAEDYGTDYFNTQSIVKPSPVDNLHLTAEAHGDIAREVCRMVRE